MTNTQPAPNRPLRVIALYKLIEATLLILVGVGALRLIHGDIGALAARLVADLHLDPNRTFIHMLLARLTGISPRTLREISAGTFVYAALRIVEGVGLWRQRRWAEYLTVVATAALLPVEVYEVAQRFSVARLAVFVVNALVVAYLVSRLWRTRAAAAAAP